MSEQIKIITFSDLVERGILEIGDGYRAKLEELGGDGPFFLRAGLLAKQGFDWASAERFRADVFPKVRSKLGQPGDTMVTTKGNSVGRAAYVPPEAPQFVYSPHLSYWRCNDSSQLSSGFLRYWSRSPEFSTQLGSMAHGTDMAPYLSLADQRRLRISLPPIFIQEAIAEVLGSLDDKIAVNEQVAVAAHELGQAYSRRAHEMGRAARLAEVARITMGSSPPGESYNEDSIGLPFYQGARDFGDRFPGHRVWCTSPVRTADSGSCLLSVRAPVGRINLAREPCCIGRGVAAVQSVQGTPSVLYHELVGSSDAWAPYESEGTVFGAINKKQLESIGILALDHESAGDLEVILAPLDQRVSSSFDENRKLAELRDTLLPRLMSGQIRVRDAEKVVEEVT